MRQLWLGPALRIDIVAIRLALLQHAQRLKQIYVLRQRSLRRTLRAIDGRIRQRRQRQIRGRHVGGVALGNGLQVAPVTRLTL